MVEDDDEDELVATYDYEAAEYGSGDAEPELPGLTDEALELLEARAPTGRRPTSRFPLCRLPFRDS